MKILKHKFVDNIPDIIEDKVLYVSMEYETVIHKCACGCGNEVVTPLSPTDWRLIFNGETISLEPSIGSWSLDCKSHYWITNNIVNWSSTYRQKEINKVRRVDSEDKYEYYKIKGKMEQPMPEEIEKGKQKQSFWRRLLSKLLR